LSQFKNGASYFVPLDALDGYGRELLGMPDNTQFILPPATVNNVIEQSKGDISELEEIMGITS
jgi:hypothetical protein